MENLMENHDISGGENDEFVIGWEKTEGSIEDVELCMVGIFLIEQNVNFNIVKRRIANSWKLVEGVTIKHIGDGRILFQFYHPANHGRILKGEPWSFGNHHLIIHPLRLGDIPLSVSLNTIIFWVQVVNIPTSSFTERIDMMLGNFVGHFL
ncbi:hypothetical protein ACS0TY_009964 [Phlomoides rotata]